MKIANASYRKRQELKLMSLVAACFLASSFSNGVTKTFALTTPPQRRKSSAAPHSTERLNDEQQQQITALYEQARQVRCRQGHEAACELYQALLRANPTDRTTASRLAANPDTPRQLQQAVSCCGDGDPQKYLREFRQLLVDCQFSSRSIAQQVFGITDEQHPLLRARCPVNLTPAAAGTVDRLPFDDSTNNDLSKENIFKTRLSCLTALFLLGLTIPRTMLHNILGPDAVRLLCNDLKLLRPCPIQPDLLLSLVSVYPVDLESSSNSNSNHTLFVATDWHPRVLSTTQIGDEQAVMYIGPDSLALVQHWILSSSPSLRSRSSDDDDDDHHIWLDLCTGSGIQALAALHTGQCQTAVCVDTNPRALKFTRWNAQLNGISKDCIHLILGDVVTGRRFFLGGVDGGGGEDDDHRDGSSSHQEEEEEEPLVPLLQRLAATMYPQRHNNNGYDCVTANPPFLPVPPALTTAARHGLFSAGGASGEQVLAGVLQVAQQVVVRPGGYVAIVSEFFFQKDESLLLQRLQGYYYYYYWTTPNSSTKRRQQQLSSADRLLLLTNEFPISADIYAQRRADSLEEYQIWKDHLQRQLQIVASSPGLLYVQALSNNNHETTVEAAVKTVVCRHERVPKSASGSMWTPSNMEAIAFTQRAVLEYFKS